MAVPAGADTFSILAGDTITVQTAGGAAGCAGGTIQLGGVLQNNSTAGFTMTDAVSHLGTFGSAGSGSNAVPTLMTLNGCVWICGTAAIWNVVGTLPYTAPDIRIVGNATSYFDFANRPGISGTISKCEFNTFGHTSGIFYRIVSLSSLGVLLNDIYFNSIASDDMVLGTAVSTTATIHLTGTLYIRGASSAAGRAFYLTNIWGTGTILVEASTAATNAVMYICYIYDTININYNESSGANKVQSCTFYGNSSLTILSVDAGNTINGVTLTDDSTLTALSSTAGRVFLASSNIVNTEGQISITNSAAGITFVGVCKQYVPKNLILTVAGGTVILNATFIGNAYWQASRSVSIAIIGAAAVTLQGTGSAIQYEPVLYISDTTNYLFAIQYDMTVGTPNYTALYGTSVGWTAATKTLAAGGQLIINTTGHTATGMDMAITDLSAWTLATTGTAVITTEAYQISFDGGVLWSGVLTLAQLRSNAYIINGNPYTTDPRYNIQIRILLTSALGGTVTQVRVTGAEYDPIGVGWNIRNTLEDIEGAGFVTGTHDLHSIHDDIAAIGVVIGALLAPILRGVEWIIMWMRKIFHDKIKG